MDLVMCTVPRLRNDAARTAPPPRILFSAAAPARWSPALLYRCDYLRVSSRNLLKESTHVYTCTRRLLVGIIVNMRFHL